jgi:hypothetical protein
MHHANQIAKEPAQSTHREVKIFEKLMGFAIAKLKYAGVLASKTKLTLCNQPIQVYVIFVIHNLSVKT